MPYVWLVGMVYFGMQDNTLAMLFWCITVIASCELFKLFLVFVDHMDKEIESTRKIIEIDEITLVEMYFHNKIWN